MSKVYYVRLNCTGFQDYKVTGAKNEEEAIDRAITQFQCDKGQGEFCELLDKTSADGAEEIEVYHD